MRRLLPIVFFVLLLSSCREKEQGVLSPVQQTLYIEGTEATRVRLSDATHTVWETGDEVSVFYDGGPNERWVYSGADGASSGILTYSAPEYRFMNGTRVVAVSPYDAENSISGNVVSLTLPAAQPWRSGSFGSSLLCAVSTTSSLSFSHAVGYVRLALRGSGAVSAVSLQGNAGEVLAGPASLDVSGASPVLSLSPSATATTLSLTGTLPTLNHSSDTFFYFAVPPVTFASGFTVSVEMSDGKTTVVHHSLVQSIAAGEVLCIDGFAEVVSSLTIDFSRASDFTPSLSPSNSRDSTRVYAHASGYNINFTPRRTASEIESGASWGYYRRSNEGGEMVLGRGGSFFPLPKVPGKLFKGLDYTPGSTNGKPYLTDDKDLQPARSNVLGSTVAGETYRMAVTDPTPDTQYYFVVSTANVVIRKIVCYYVDE
ncbi:MAG: hypothetical protein IJV01_04460 [Bacteroidales bacterium]|nr:hypothetical protein [Bacteroidales bacterium]